MFVGTGTPRKPAQRSEARRLRAEEGLPYKRIAKRLGVSPSSVFHWTRDIEITEEQRRRNLAHMTPESEVTRKRVASWRAVNRARRMGYQEEGRRRAKKRDPLHQGGCFLYWAEGAKSRNTLGFANSDVNMVRFFVRFLRESLEVRENRIRMNLNVYTGNGLSIEEIEQYWLDALGVDRSCLRAHIINHFPTSSSGKKRDRLPYGVCFVKVHSTRLVQHIYGAIQEYAGFEEPRWLDCAPR
jgi:transposase-like protein